MPGVAFETNLVNTFGRPARCVYNGFDFNRGNTLTLGVSAEAVSDSAGRTTKFNRYKLRFRTYFDGDVTTLVTAARQSLTKYGAGFEYTGRGIDLRVNVGTVRDVEWGPKPRVIDFDPVGMGNAISLEWEVETVIPECSAARYALAPLEFAYTVTYAIDEAGYTSRTVTGHVQVPATRRGAGNRSLPDTADRLRDRIAPDVPEGFRRLWAPWTLNEAKTRADFSFTDEEMDDVNIPPEGCHRANGDHTINSTAAGLLRWSGTISADYEMQKRASPDAPARAFFTLCKSRVAHLAASLRRVPKADFDAKETSLGILPVAMSVREPELYGRRKIGFSLAFTFTCPVQHLLGASGLWHAVPNTGWRRWAYSLRGGSFNPRGSAGMVFDVGDEKIVDLCSGEGGEIDLGGAEMRGTQPIRTAIGGTFARLVSETFPEPKAEESWVYYESELFIETDSGTITLRTLPDRLLGDLDDIFGKAGDIAGEAWDAITGALPRTRPTSGTTGRDDPTAGTMETYRSVRPLVYVYLRGRAARAGYPVPVPRLMEMGGAKAIPANRLDRGEGFAQGVKFAAGGTPIYTGRWNLRYGFDRTPRGRLPIPPNPLLGSGK